MSPLKNYKSLTYDEVLKHRSTSVNPGKKRKVIDDDDGGTKKKSTRTRKPAQQKGETRRRYRGALEETLRRSAKPQPLLEEEYPLAKDVPVVDPYIKLGFDHLLDDLDNVVEDTIKNLNSYATDAPVFQLDVDMDDIVAGKPSNDRRRIEKLERQCDGMCGQPLHAHSGRFIDKKRKLILSYFSFRKDSETGAVDNFTRREWSSGHEHDFPVFEGTPDKYEPDEHTPEKLQEMRDAGVKMIYDGIDKRLLEKLQILTQSYASASQPTNLDGDGRHLKSQKVMRYPSKGGEGTGTNGSGFWFEAAGTYHFVHARFMQGHETNKDALFVSKDFHGGTVTEMMAGQRYILATNQIARLLDKMFEKLYPDFHRKHKAAFEAGKWYAEAEGAWLGMAIVYKLQTDLHIDKGDGEYPVAIFCMGQYTEGYLEMPDLNMRFYYRPGDVVITFTGVFHHRVTKWEALAESGIPGVTPGRIAITEFTPGTTLTRLVNKEPGHVRKTMGGIYSSKSL